MAKGHGGKDGWGQHFVGVDLEERCILCRCPVERVGRGEEIHLCTRIASMKLSKGLRAVSLSNPCSKQRSDLELRL